MSPEAADFHRLGRDLRKDILGIFLEAGRGHVASAFSIVEILVVLFETALNFDAANPDWPDRDRFILSKGHGCLALYAILAKKGFFPREELSRFCKPGGILGGHPDHRHIPGIETSTGSLGHGLSVGVGMAVAARLDRAGHRVFVLVGDGECNEGSIWEAALSAAHRRLDNLTVLVDYNKLQSFGTTREILDLEPFADKWRAFGFAAEEVDMTRPERLAELLRRGPAPSGKPTAIVCHTVKGKGISFMEGNPSWHHRTNLTDDERRLILKELED